jgi:hypothetical protein
MTQRSEFTSQLIDLETTHACVITDLANIGRVAYDRPTGFWPIGKALGELQTRRFHLPLVLSFGPSMSNKGESAIHRANPKRRLVFSLHHRESNALQS